MIIVLIGVAGSGKTTVGELLAARLRFPFLDADELHTPECVEQMTRGEPLTDAQRNAWFGRVVAAAEARDPLVLACSMLRRTHRDRVRAVGDVRMFLLDMPASVLERRLQQRPGHFFPARLLQGQLETLERPLPEEGIVVVDAARPATDVLGAIVAKLERERPSPRHEQG
jgi:gluconokinase